MDNVIQTHEFLYKAEELGSEVLELKEHIFLLNQRLNECREALAYVSKNDIDKAYIFQGALLIKNSKENIIVKLKADFKNLNEEIKAKGDAMRDKVYELQRLEQTRPFPGQSIVPLEKGELNDLLKLWTKP